MDAIHLEGVRVHNLDDLTLSLPLHRLVAVTGISGSGKSSLAFDTLAVEGQRRYIETLSATARQFLDRLERPDADRIENIPPTIAIRQGISRVGVRDTIATATEVHDYLRLLFAGGGEIRCPACNTRVAGSTPAGIARRLADDLDPSIGDGRFQVAFEASRYEPVVGEIPGRLAEDGFRRLLVADGDGNRSVENVEDLAAADAETAWVVLDRLVIGRAEIARVEESLEQALECGAGHCLVLSPAVAAAAGTPADGPRQTVTIDGEAWDVRAFLTGTTCEGCGREFTRPQPRLFSFHSPLGACPSCRGVGTVPMTSSEEPVPDPSDSLPEPAGRRRADVVCGACDGRRLQPDALCVHLPIPDAGDPTIDVLCGMTVLELRETVATIAASIEGQLARTVLSPLRHRLEYLGLVGLDYLTLDRPLRTLSGGESRRVRLTAALGSELVNTLYVLDEPTAGLHAADIEQVLAAVGQLVERGNSVVVVEHDPAFIRAADEVIDIGPGAGRDGGRLVFQGSPADLAACDDSLTGGFLSGRLPETPTLPGRRTAAEPAEASEASEASLSRPVLTLRGATLHNLKNLTLTIPLGRLVVVTGVSGSGKSSLVEGTLYPAVCEALGQRCERGASGNGEAGCWESIEGTGSLDQVLLVDASPIGRTPRSIPMTFLKAFDDIRRVFAETLEAKRRGYTARQFSFNTADGGRCAECGGSGEIEIDMQFLADIRTVCPECLGTRFGREVLEVTHRGRSIADVLAMTVGEAFGFFRGQPRIRRRLQCLRDVGLGYLPLGQPATTLSGGESQRLKLAAFLAGTPRRTTLFLLNEPTTGLHAADVQRLLECLDTLLAVGHSLVVIEHHLELIAAAEHVIDLGPGAGSAGGEVVVTGTPAEVAGCRESVTGLWLACYNPSTGSTPPDDRPARPGHPTG